MVAMRVIGLAYTSTKRAPQSSRSCIWTCCDALELGGDEISKELRRDKQLPLCRHHLHIIVIFQHGSTQWLCAMPFERQCDGTEYQDDAHGG